MTEERFKETAHINYGKEGHGYEYVSTSRPRLRFRARYHRGGAVRDRLWLVDGEEETALKEAAEALLKFPPKLKKVEAEALTLLTEEPQRLHEITGKSTDGLETYGNNSPATIKLHALLALTRKGIAHCEKGMIKKMPGDPPYTTE